MPKDQDIARFHIVTSGSFWLKVDNVDYESEIQEGDILIVFNGLEHKIKEKKNSKVMTQLELNTKSRLTSDKTLILGAQDSKVTNIVCGHFSFKSSKTHPFVKSLPNILHIKKNDNHHSTWMLLMLNYIDVESKFSKPGSEIILQKLTEVIFIQAFRVYAETISMQTHYLNLISDQYAKKSLDAMHGSINEKWSLERLSAIAGMSRTRFCTHFKNISGMTPMEYLTNLRLETSKHLLEATDHSIPQIATKVGYPSHEHYQKIFKTKFGITPSKYRKQSLA